MLKQISKSQQTIGIIQITLAQHFSLMGLQSIANALARRPVIENEPLKIHGGEIEEVQRGQAQAYTFRFSLPLPIGAMTFNQREVTRIDFEMTCSRDLYMQLINSNDLNSTLLELAEAAYQHEWLFKSTDYGTTVISPLGFTMNLAYSLVESTTNQSRG